MLGEQMVAFTTQRSRFGPIALGLSINTATGYLRYFSEFPVEAMISPSVPTALGMHFVSSPNAVSEE
jgi:hypothetical protein